MISRLAKQLGQADSCAYFLLGFFQAAKPPPKDTIVWMLCHWAELATSRNSHLLLNDTLSLAAAFNISVGDVVGASMRATGASMRPSTQPPPAGLVPLDIGFLPSLSPNNISQLGFLAMTCDIKHVITCQAGKKAWKAITKGADTLKGWPPVAVLCAGG